MPIYIYIYMHVCVHVSWVGGQILCVCIHFLLILKLYEDFFPGVFQTFYIQPYTYIQFYNYQHKNTILVFPLSSLSCFNAQPDDVMLSTSINLRTEPRQLDF